MTDKWRAAGSMNRKKSKRVLCYLNMFLPRAVSSLTSRDCSGVMLPLSIGSAPPEVGAGMESCLRRRRGRDGLGPCRVVSPGAGTTGAAGTGYLVVHQLRHFMELCAVDFWQNFQTNVAML